MPETTPLIKAALNLRGGAGFDVYDKIWGIGLSMGDPDRLEISKWKGQNLLGYTLMMVRDWL